MSQWLDMAASGSVGSTSTVDTSGVSLDSITFAGTAANPQTATVDTSSKMDKTMLYLTFAGVVFAGLAFFKGHK